MGQKHKKKRAGSTVANPTATCFAVNVDVSGVPAVWIFSEFETDESLDVLRDWLEPDNWPSWGGEMFKEMRPTGPVTQVGVLPGVRQTHANYLEVVEIGGRRLDTVLHCDLKSTPTWAAVSYDLDHSIGNMLQVDRGYLLALDVAGRRQVKALKVVGFTDTLLNTFATTVCPEWGTWVQRAVNVAAVQASGGSVDPTPGSVGDSDPDVSRPGADAGAFTGGIAEQWVSTVTDMAEFYGQYASDVGARLWSGSYGQKDAAQDGSSTVPTARTRLVARMAGRHGRHCELGGGGRPADGGRRSGPEWAHRRAHRHDRADTLPGDGGVDRRPAPHRPAETTRSPLLHSPLSTVGGTWPGSRLRERPGRHDGRAVRTLRRRPDGRVGGSRSRAALREQRVTRRPRQES